MMWAYWFAGMMQTGPDDRMYDCLPMYHSIGGIVAPASVLVGGGSVVLTRAVFRQRNSGATSSRWDCTLFQYIGELCRYLTAALPSPRSASIGCGFAAETGCAPMSGRTFRDRFRIPADPRILRRDGRHLLALQSARGRPARSAGSRLTSPTAFPAAIVRFDPESRRTGPRCGRPLHPLRPQRGRRGDRQDQCASSRFEGYTNDAETEKKILRDVFEPGDAWFRTGDLMRQDEKGFFYFVDRVGGSFRWKGENVSTLEVHEAIASCPGVVDAHVYGVKVPGAEGRAGMAALEIGGDFDLAILHAHLAERLPDYARPLFLRLREKLELTETFKPKTFRLASEGFDPDVITDALYFDDPNGKAYARLDQTIFDRIAAGRIRL